MPPLQDWANFYVIVGSSAAALTGLQFVVMALLNDTSNVVGGEEELSAYATPKIVHFSAVLLISAICAMPHQSDNSLGICLIVTGFAGVIYAAFVWTAAQKTRQYTPVLEDWIFHVILPISGYALLFASGIAELGAHEGALYIVASVVLILLFVSIHNAWDTAVYISQTSRQRAKEPRADESA